MKRSTEVCLSLSLLKNQYTWKSTDFRQIEKEFKAWIKTSTTLKIIISMMIKSVLFLSLSAFTLLTVTIVSPDGKSKLMIELKDESDQQTRYIAKLIQEDSDDTLVVVNCIRRDLPAPNFYWSKDSQYLIFEQCSESFQESKIKILNLKTRKVDVELTGLVGNKDVHQQQFDSTNGILIYFDTAVPKGNKIPDLYSFDLNTRKKKKMMGFEVNMDMEFPVLKKIRPRQLQINYGDHLSGQMFSKLITY